MDENSVMYQLMDLRLNESFNAAILADEEYMTITKRSGEYSEKLDAMQLSKDAREMIDRYVSEQNALGSRYGALAYLLGFSDCKELFCSAPHFTS